MKSILKYSLIAMGCIAFAASCSNDVSYDSEYDIKGYYNGSDPRQNLASFGETKIDVPVSILGDIAVSKDEVEKNLVINLTRPTKNGKIEFVINEAAPELATTYKDYEVGKMENIQFESSSIAIPEGKSSFEVKATLKNLSKISKNTVLPLSIKLSGDNIQNATDQSSVCYITLSPKNVLKVEAENTSFNVSLSDGEATYTSGNSLRIAAQADGNIAEGYTIELVANKALFDKRHKNLEKATLAPEGIVASVAAQPLTKRVLMTANFVKPESFKNTGTYVLPLQLVVTDKAGVKHPITADKQILFATFTVTKSMFTASENSLTGTVLDASSWKITNRYGTSEGDIKKLFTTSTDETDGYYVHETDHHEITVDCIVETGVKGIEIDASQDQPKDVTIYFSADGQDWKQVTATENMLDKEVLSFQSGKERKTRYIKFSFNLFQESMTLDKITILK